MAIELKITDSMLRTFLDTDAKPDQIASSLSLCGPSFERVHKIEGGHMYEIEVTVNRVDMASSYGIAKEAAAILPQFGYKAKLKTPKLDYSHLKGGLKNTPTIKTKKVKYFAGIIISGVDGKIVDQKLKTALEGIGESSKNYIVDATNIAMYSYGAPVHAFDMDKIDELNFTAKEASGGEKISILDGREIILEGGEIVFEDKGGLFDLVGIMGGDSSKVTEATKKILLVTEIIDPLQIRKSSIKHECRTHAAVLNEKQPSLEAYKKAILYACDLIVSTKGKFEDSFVYDKLEQTKQGKVVVELSQINSTLGVNLSKNEIEKILTPLVFEIKWEGEVGVFISPIERQSDINIPEDVIEEIARIYGYFKLPKVLMAGPIPVTKSDPIFAFEKNIRTLLSGFGGHEIMTLSMVASTKSGNEIKILNPLGESAGSMRTSLKDTTLSSLNDNNWNTEPMFLFEIANVYIKDKGKNSHSEISTLSIGFANFDQRRAQGIIDGLKLKLRSKKINHLAKVGDYFIFEQSVSELMEVNEREAYKIVQKKPFHFEDITLTKDDGEKVADLIHSIEEATSDTLSIDLLDIHENKYTFRIVFNFSKSEKSEDEILVLRERLEKKLSRRIG
jgi:phenylalanyl-tRNA synthetase beta chain